MRKYLRKLAGKIAPTAYGRLQQLSMLDESGSATEILLRYEADLREMRAQLDELRRENRRAVELYDLMFARLQRENPLREVEAA